MYEINCLLSISFGFILFLFYNQDIVERDKNSLLLSPFSQMSNEEGSPSILAFSPHEGKYSKQYADKLKPIKCTP